MGKISKENYTNAKQVQSPYLKQTRNFWFGVGFVILLFSVSFVQPARTEGASLFLSPASESFTKGDAFLVEVKVNAEGIPINATQATIYFPADKLEVLNISKDDSVFDLWPEEPTFSNSAGEISFAGGLPHPGCQEIENLITIEFKAKKEGQTYLTFDRARVLADDGKGTNVLAFLKEAKYSVFKEISFPEVKPEVSLPQILALTHLKGDEWYNNPAPNFQWNLTPEIAGVSFILDQNSETVPDEISEGRIQLLDYEEISDGIWYFHLRFEDKNGWSETAHCKIQIDTSPPHLFEVVIDNEGDPTNPSPSLYFETSDDTSGVSHYKLKIDEDHFLNLMTAQVNPFSPPSQTPGSHPIIVRAVDKAGNNVETETILDIEPIESPQITLWPQLHISGEEIFYIEGEAVPKAEITIFLKKNDKEVKRWQTFSNDHGEWSFSTKELIKSGTYYLSALAKDERGAESLVSESYKIEISLSGFSLGLFMISFKTLVLFLFSALLIGIIIAGYFVYRIRRARKILRKETDEVKKNLHRAFSALREELKEQIEMFDLKPGFSEKERKVYDDLKEALDISEKFIEKEIKDVERELE